MRKIKIIPFAFALIISIGNTAVSSEADASAAMLFDSWHKDIQQEMQAQTSMSVFDGYVMSDDGLSGYYRMLVSQGDFGNAEHLVVLENNGGKNATIAMTPAMAQKIVSEIEPYILLNDRGRKFNEEIKVDDLFTINVRSGNEMSFTLTRKKDKARIILKGNSVKLFAASFKQAEADSRLWLLEQVFGGLATGSLSKDIEKSRFEPQQPLEPIYDGIIMLQTISEDYENNEIAAEQKYAPFVGRPITVRGTVGKITKDSSSSLPRVQFAEGINFMPFSCTFADDVDIIELATLQPEQVIVVEGILQTWESDISEANIIEARIVQAE